MLFRSKVAVARAAAATAAAAVRVMAAAARARAAEAMVVARKGAEATDLVRLCRLSLETRLAGARVVVML